MSTRGPDRANRLTWWDSVERLEWRIKGHLVECPSVQCRRILLPRGWERNQLLQQLVSHHNDRYRNPAGSHDFCHHKQRHWNIRNHHGREQHRDVCHDGENVWWRHRNIDFGCTGKPTIVLDEHNGSGWRGSRRRAGGGSSCVVGCAGIRDEEKKGQQLCFQCIPPRNTAAGIIVRHGADVCIHDTACQTAATIGWLEQCTRTPRREIEIRDAMS